MVVAAPDARIELVQDVERVPRFPDFGDPAVLGAIHGNAGVVEATTSWRDSQELASRRSSGQPPHRHDVAARDREDVDDREVREGDPLLLEPLLDPSVGVVAGLAGHRGRVHQDVWRGDPGERSEAVTAQHFLEPAGDECATRRRVDGGIPAVWRLGCDLVPVGECGVAAVEPVDLEPRVLDIGLD